MEMAEDGEALFVNVILGSKTEDVEGTEAEGVDCRTAEQEYGLWIE
jgi:hypothetical protein